MTLRGRSGSPTASSGATRKRVSSRGDEFILITGFPLILCNTVRRDVACYVSDSNREGIVGLTVELLRLVIPRTLLQ